MGVEIKRIDELWRGDAIDHQDLKLAWEDDMEAMYEQAFGTEYPKEKKIQPETMSPWDQFRLNDETYQRMEARSKEIIADAQAELKKIQENNVMGMQDLSKYRNMQYGNLQHKAIEEQRLARA